MSGQLSDKFKLFCQILVLKLSIGVLLRFASLITQQLHFCLMENLQIGTASYQLPSSGINSFALSKNRNLSEDCFDEHGQCNVFVYAKLLAATVSGSGHTSCSSNCQFPTHNY